jgi:hypothetical protein
MCVTDEWKVIVLRRYAGEFPPYSGAGSRIAKNSEDIAFDLSGMGDIPATDVSAFMAVSGYEIEFDDGRPVWLLSEANPKNAVSE